jgi:hypothetical protein
MDQSATLPVPAALAAGLTAASAIFLISLRPA